MKRLIIRTYGFYLELLGLIFPRKAGYIGFMLFCRPFRLAITQKQKEFFNTADRFTVDLEGKSIQCYRWGSGAKKVLFLHGWQSHSYRWKPYIESLSKDEYTIYSVDAPGHGLSEGDFLSVPLYSSLMESFIKEHGPFNTVVSHSLGSFTLLYTLYRQPLLPIAKVILMAPPGEANDFVSVFRQTLNLSERTLQLMIDHFVTRYEVSPEYFSTMRFVSKINARGLIIHDEDDNEAPYHYSVPLQQIWQKSRLVTTKGFGHNLRSTIVVKHVTDFIEDKVHHDSLVAQHDQ